VRPRNASFPPALAVAAAAVVGVMAGAEAGEVAAAVVAVEGMAAAAGATAAVVATKLLRDRKWIVNARCELAGRCSAAS
jgi:hypothetical protein